MIMANNPDYHQPIVQALSDASESSFKKYCRIYVGSHSWKNFFHYELRTCFSLACPGALGIWLRQKLLPPLFQNMGPHPKIGPGFGLRSPNRIQIGHSFVADTNVSLDAKGNGSHIDLGNDVFLGSGVILSCADASITMGSSVSLGFGCIIRASRGPIQMGSHITAGAHSIIISGNPDYRRSDIPMMEQLGSARGITIGDDVWMGVGVRVIDGVTIGNGCVIGAGSVVIRDVRDLEMVAGVPAKVMGHRTGCYRLSEN